MAGTRFNSDLVKVVLMVLLMAAGISMISLAFIVDWVGISLPGFSRKQESLAIAGVLIVLLAAALCLLRKRITDELVALAIAETLALLPPKRDTIIAFALFCAGVTVGTLYVLAVQSHEVGLFYPPTRIVKPPVVGGLVISYGIFLDY